MLGPNELGRAVTGVRTLILADPPRRESTLGIQIPGEALMKMFSGKILDAGLQALDTMHDHGYQIGDRVEFGRHAGTYEEWDHIIEGDHTLPDDQYEWRFFSHEPGEARK